MAPRKPKQESTETARSSSGRIAKGRVPPKSDAQPRSYRMKRYKNGLMNLEKTSAYLVPVVQANANSPLLRLPAEIRNKIWEYTCGGHTILLPRTWKTIGKGGAVESPKSQDGTGRDRSYDAAARKLAASHLPEVYRQVFAGTALTSYKINTFICHDIVVSRTRPMARLMAAQRRVVTTLEPGFWALDDTIYFGNMQDVSRIWTRHNI